MMEKMNQGKKKRLRDKNKTKQEEEEREKEEEINIKKINRREWGERHRSLGKNKTKENNW